MTQPGTDADAIRALELQRYEAMLHCDIPTLESIFADQLTYTHSNATRDTKISYLEKLRTGHTVYNSIDAATEQITVLGDCALVVGRMRAEVETGGVLAQLNNTALVVWVRGTGLWQCVAYQPTVNP